MIIRDYTSGNDVGDKTPARLFRVSVILTCSQTPRWVVTSLGGETSAAPEPPEPPEQEFASRYEAEEFADRLAQACFGKVDLWLGEFDGYESYFADYNDRLATVKEAEDDC